MLSHDQIRPPFQSELVEIDGLPVCVPILGVQMGETALQLHWWNATCLLFGNNELNHVEYTGDEGKKGIAMAPDMIGLMREMQYPTYFRPLPDPETLSWYSALKMAELDIDLDNL